MLSAIISILLALKDHHLSEQTARIHVEAARAASTVSVPAEVLLAIAYNETKFDALSVSTVRGKHFCGVTQANAHASRARCKALRDPAESYAQTVKQLTRRMDDMQAPLAVVLAGYVCGKSYRAPTCRAYAGRVLALAKRLELAAGIPTS